MTVRRHARPAAALFVSFVVSAGTATAHHSRVEYIDGEILELEGEVIGVVWRNPHIMITVRAPGADGTLVDWVLEGPGASNARQEGAVDGYVAVGDRVRAAGNRSDRRERWLRLANVLGPSGTEVAFTGAGPRWSDDYIGAGRGQALEVAAEAVEPDGIFRVWVYTDATPYVVTELPPLKPEALAAYQAYDPLEDDPVLECTLPGVPRVTTIAGARPFEFLRQGEDILIKAQNYNRTRVIHMNADAVPAGLEPTPLGYSRGRWDGDTLVVTTTHISYPFFDLAPWWGIPQTPTLELVERFTLEGDALVYDLWAYDPATFTEPIDKPRVIVWHWEPGLTVGTDQCVPYYQ
ncbi:MAG TPA: DUF6152 family protein [Gammaproteobacteria bacterium]|nr:DUF6152 family protein [Gammaproteobacteria bacterium]